MSTQIPLSYQQQWLWNLLQSYPDWRSLVTYAYCVKGPLNLELLERSLAEVVSRHGSLRTTVSGEQDAPYLLMHEQDAFGLEIQSVDGASAENIETQARLELDEFSELKVNLVTGPLMKARLLRLSDCEHWLLLGMHRLAADCASIDQVAHELWVVYGNLLRGQPSSFSSAPGQYSDYARWQRESREAWRERHENYWRQRLEGAAPITWPGDSNAAAAERGALGAMSSMFDPQLSAAIHATARKTKTLAATALLVAYLAVLWRWCRQRDFVVPFNIAGRQSEHREIVGYFSHILLLRIQLRGDETYAELMRNVGNEFFKALMHQDFGRLSTEAPHLLAGSYFQWISWHVGENKVQSVPHAGHPAAVTVERVAAKDYGEGLTGIPPGMVDVEMTFFDTAQGIYASGVYRKDRFTRETMARFMEDLQAAARQLITDSGARLA